MNYEESKRLMLDQREEARRRGEIVAASMAVQPVNSTDGVRQSAAERKKNKPGRFWARSSAGVYMNAHRRKMNGY